jgi:hypothetical protein
MEPTQAPDLDAAQVDALWRAQGFGAPAALQQHAAAHDDALESALTCLARNVKEVRDESDLHTQQIASNKQAIDVLQEAGGAGLPGGGSSTLERLLSQVNELLAWKQSASGHIATLQAAAARPPPPVVGGGLGEGGGGLPDLARIDDELNQLRQRVRAAEADAAAQSKSLNHVLQLVTAQSAMEDVVASMDLEKVMAQFESGEVTVASLEESDVFRSTLRKAEMVGERALDIAAPGLTAVGAFAPPAAVDVGACFSAWVGLRTGWLRYDAAAKPMSAQSGRSAGHGASSRGGVDSRGASAPRPGSEQPSSGHAAGAGVDHPMPSRGSSRGRSSTAGSSSEEPQRQKRPGSAVRRPLRHFRRPF